MKDIPPHREKSGNWEKGKTSLTTTATLPGTAPATWVDGPLSGRLWTLSCFANNYKPLDFSSLTSYLPTDYLSSASASVPVEWD